MNEGRHRRAERQYPISYVLLTILLFTPLLWAFVAVRNLYPFAAWSVMMAGGDLKRGRTYFVLRGETLAGETVDVNAIELTNALSGRIFMMFLATADNAGFRIRSLHPQNMELADRFGGVDKLPNGARVPELLRAYGDIYNARLPSGSTHRLRAVTLDSYRWAGGSYSGYRNFVKSWRLEL